MTSYFNHALDELIARYHALGKFSRYLLMVMGALLLISSAVIALRPAPLSDLSEGHRLRRVNFFTLWQQGNLVVLTRHAERCDHSTHPCLAQPDGITVKGRQMAEKLGQSLQKLGLANANIYNSPLRRTEQTSSYAFNRTTQGQDWLIHCRKSMLDNVLKHKLDHQNLILVTHSECIADLEKSLNVPAPSTPDYGASVIVSVNPIDHSAKVLGFIDAQGWGKVLTKYL